MFSHLTSLNNYHFATTYGNGTYNADTYNGAPTTNTTTPGAPNTGFFQSVVSGQNEMWLIPIILVGAVVIAAAVMGVKKLVRAHKA
jgi:hypothetical protein